MKEPSKWLWIDRENKDGNKNYIGMFDLTKGLFMIIIIFTHAVYEVGGPTSYLSSSAVWIQILTSPLLLLHYGFIPVLFLTCGYGIRRQPVRKYIKKTLKMLAVPYTGVMLAVVLGTVVKWMIAGGSLSWRLWYHIMPFVLGWCPSYSFRSNVVGEIGPMWFPLTYIVSCIILNMVLQQKRVWAQILLLLAGSIFALTMGNVSLPYCIWQSLVCSGLLFAGMYMKKWKVPQRKVSIFWVFLVYALCLFSRINGGYVEIASNTYRNGIVDLILSYAAGILLLCLCQKLDVIQGIIADKIRWIGRHMIWFCCFHTISNVIVPWDDINIWLQGRIGCIIIVNFTASFIYAWVSCILLDVWMKKYLNKKRFISI